MRIRLLPYEVAGGAANMAADEALRETAAKHGLASVRFYGWSEPTVSLGYFQPTAARLSRHPVSQLPWVRRPTGGAALVHHHELTYALALPAGTPWQVPGESWLCRMHQAITRALARLGVSAAGCPAEVQTGDVLCFLHHTPGDLIIDGHKVVGSAQRKRHGALLQHGAILLAQSEHTPQLPGLQELTGKDVNHGLLALAILAEAGWEQENGTWTAEERERRAALADKYASAAWNEKR